jgi:hypothetical protein
MDDILLLPRFSEQVRTHLIANFLDLPVRPIICGIFGRSGDGKSAQLEASLEQCHVEAYRINASDLESGTAGEPGKLIARTYSAASLAISKKAPVALVVEDIDTTVGEWELNTGTVNHQQVIAELMHLADRPVDPLRSAPARVPIFVTGNNLSRLYAPLRRHGRMYVAPWRPEPAEVHAVAVSLLGGIASERAIRALTAEFGEEPLAFFAAVRKAVLEAGLRQYIGGIEPDMRTLLRRGSDISRYSVQRIEDDDLFRIARHTRTTWITGQQDYLAMAPGGVR